MKKSVLISVFCCLISGISQAQITRGAQPGEIYISTDWYIDNNNQIHYAILHCTDNGEHISIAYENIETPPGGEMSVGKVLGDATPGALYNYGNNELWVSLDYGVSWEFQENFTYVSYATGFSNGEIFRRSNNNLHRSSDYGDTFDLIVESLSEPLSDVGNQIGQLYGFTGSAGIAYKLYYSQDFGNSFTMLLIDSLVAFWAPSGQFPRISRGTEPGELYLTSWTPELHYKIFHSVDTGYTWTEKYESDYINIYYWSVKFTAGRESGSFYVMRARINPPGDHVWLYIDYSSDYGQTFTTYFHDLDSLFTSVEPIQKQDFEINAYPNPFSGSTKIRYNVENKATIQLNIYSYTGQLIKSIDEGTQPKGTHFIEFDAKGLKDGVYLFSISLNGKATETRKMTIMN
jgi:hypothetical protein